MTDKEKLDAIRAEIYRLVDVRGYDREMANDLFAFMDSLPNEPVSSIWHDSSEEPNGDNSIVIAYDNGCTVEPSFKDFKSYSEWGTIKKSYRVKQWAYLDDLLNLSNIQRTVKNWKEPVSEDLEEASAEYAATGEILANGKEMIDFQKQKAFKAGAKWQKEKEYTCYEEAFEDGAKWKVENLWKLADGDELPEIDREVIALIRMDGFFQIPPDEPVEMTYKVVFAHRPNPDGWDGKSLTTGEVEHYTPKTYGKGGWNIPDVKFWLDVKLPKEIEEL